MKILEVLTSRKQFAFFVRIYKSNVLKEKNEYKIVSYYLYYLIDFPSHYKYGFYVLFSIYYSPNILSKLKVNYVTHSSNIYGCD